MRGAVAVLVVIPSLFAVGCLPFIGNAKVPLRPDPIAFRDTATNSVVTPVLMLPRYSAHTGISTGAGHGPGAMASVYYIADPFIYRAGEEFRPRQPKTVGALWLGGGFTGRGVGLDGVLVVAVGYRPKWVWNLWGQDLEDQFQLDPLPPGPAQVALEQIQEILQDRKLKPEAYDLWSLGPRHQLESRLDGEERTLVARFLSEGIASLQVNK